MSTRIVLIDHVQYVATRDGDICTGCPRHARNAGICQHFGLLATKPGTTKTYLRHASCIRAEERAGHAAFSSLMLKGDFDGS